VCLCIDAYRSASSDAFDCAPYQLMAQPHAAVSGCDRNPPDGGLGISQTRGKAARIGQQAVGPDFIAEKMERCKIKIVQILINAVLLNRKDGNPDL